MDNGTVHSTRDEGQTTYTATYEGTATMDGVTVTVYVITFSHDDWTRMYPTLAGEVFVFEDGRVEYEVPRGGATAVDSLDAGINAVIEYNEGVI